MSAIHLQRPIYKFLNIGGYHYNFKGMVVCLFHILHTYLFFIINYSVKIDLMRKLLPLESGQKKHKKI